MARDDWDDEGPCEVCCLSVDLCICPECPHCKQVGNPKCYKGLNPATRLKLTREQAIARAQAREWAFREVAYTERMYCEALKAGQVEHEEDLRNDPQPDLTWRVR